MLPPVAKVYLRVMPIFLPMLGIYWYLGYPVNLVYGVSIFVISMIIRHMIDEVKY